MCLSPLKVDGFGEVLSLDAANAGRALLCVEAVTLAVDAPHGEQGLTGPGRFSYFNALTA